jgi:hypothetical protein
MSRAYPTTIEDKALELLGNGVNAEQVAITLGVTAGRISQLLSVPEFSDKVTDIRFSTLQKHNTRDDSYDRVEDKLLHKLEQSIPLMFKPSEVLNALKIVNGATRRGATNTQQTVTNQTIVNLNLPNIVVEKFATNINNQVTRAGDQELLTIPSNTLLEQTNESNRLTETAGESEEQRIIEAL